VQLPLGQGVGERRILEIADEREAGDLVGQGAAQLLPVAGEQVQAFKLVGRKMKGTARFAEFTDETLFQLAGRTQDRDLEILPYFEAW